MKPQDDQLYPEYPATPHRGSEDQSEGSTARPECDIDYSDIPEFTEEQWKSTQRGVFHLEGEALNRNGETVTDTMSESAFQKIERGLEEAKAYMEGEREGYQVTAPSGATPWANLEHKASPEKREQLKQEALAELDAKTISEWPKDSEAGRR